MEEIDSESSCCDCLFEIVAGRTDQTDLCRRAIRSAKPCRREAVNRAQQTGLQGKIEFRDLVEE
ncbi:hypothetical protein GCM10011507_09460 [Edaphobacter acidisoli]|uniref:Uncharacterized protein n=1 Tax=Edaphobacter acidisoli TaxID=2040573 RepID=A0A916RKZ2_9BACT|nr:hypothetical protein GCM10011507_09460 [Edaphobacter acidisoli]